MTHIRYPRIWNALAVYFSTNSPYGYSEGRLLFEDELTRDAYREHLFQELLEMFQDKEVDWLELLNNVDYEVDDEITREEAKTFIVEEIWGRVSPAADLPIKL